MKYCRFIIVFMFCFLVPALSSAHRCRFKKSDDRNLCLAKKENVRYFCSYIKASDQKKYCYAYIDITPDKCSGIEQEALRVQCEAEVQKLFDLDQKEKEKEAKIKAAQDALSKKRQEQQAKKAKKNKKKKK
jgi:hypothetical protein